MRRGRYEEGASRRWQSGRERHLHMRTRSVPMSPRRRAHRRQLHLSVTHSSVQTVTDDPGCTNSF